MSARDGRVRCELGDYLLTFRHQARFKMRPFKVHSLLGGYPVTDQMGGRKELERVPLVPFWEYIECAS